MKQKNGVSTFTQSMNKGLSLWQKYPEIEKAISYDLEQFALAEKIKRLKDKKWQEEKTNRSIISEELEGSEEILRLAKGRDRMSAKVVFFFFLIRGYLGSIKSEKSYTFIMESKYVELFLRSEDKKKIPGASTIVAHLNNLTENTLRLLHRVTIKEALSINADDFKKLYFDSTRISANATWPTESKTIVGLTSRIFLGFQTLSDYNIKINFPHGTEDKITQIKKYALEIALTSGKKNSKNNRKKLYRPIISLSKSLQTIFSKALARALKKIGDILPSIKEAIASLCEWIEVDLYNLNLCTSNAKKRVLENIQVSPEEKVLGIADPDAAMIHKGTRQLVFGYKPQIGRSENGFIVSVIVPQGAAADSDQMKEITDSAIFNTGVDPSVLSYDDGYTNKKVRQEYIDKGVEVVSFSGAKGKKLTDDVWDDETYLNARNERSMAESTIATLKMVFDLSRFSRRGIEAVTQELLTACIYHNIKLLSKC